MRYLIMQIVLFGIPNAVDTVDLSDIALRHRGCNDNVSDGGFQNKSSGKKRMKI